MAESGRNTLMLAMEKIDRYFSAFLLSSSGSICPLSFLVMSSDTNTLRGKDTKTDTILFLCSGGVMATISLSFVGNIEVKQERQSSFRRTRALFPMTIVMKNRVQ